MTPSELKANILKHDPDSHYFDRKTMQFFLRYNEELQGAESGNRRRCCLGTVPEKAGQTRLTKLCVFPHIRFSTGS